MAAASTAGRTIARRRCALPRSSFWPGWTTSRAGPKASALRSTWRLAHERAPCVRGESAIEICRGHRGGRLGASRRPEGSKKTGAELQAL
jgi:hypothetical protein